jgi:putative DNA primase/helicase
MAYTFWRDNPYEVITTILGGGHNGKSVLFGLLTALHGADNVSNVSIKTIAESPYGLHDLVDKDCNLNEELSSMYLRDTATLKKVTGRSRVRVEQKWRNAYDTTLHAKLWVCANRLPKAEDDSLAWFKRNIVIAFPNTFVDGVNADTGLLGKLTAEDELSGMFNLLMLALRRILKEGKIFLNNLLIEDRREKYERACDPIPPFLQEAISEESVETNSVTKALLYAAYEHYCNKYKLAKESIINLGKILKQRHSFREDIQYDEDGKKVRVWVGVALTGEYLNATIGRQETLDAHAA